MTFLSRDSNPLLSRAAARERGHGAPWSGDAGQTGDQSVLLAPVEWVELGEKYVPKINRATVTNADFDKAAAQSGAIAADMTAGVVLQSAGAMESRVGAKNAPPSAGTAPQTTGAIVIKDHTYLRISGVVDNSGWHCQTKRPEPPISHLVRL